MTQESREPDLTEAQARRREKLARELRANLARRKGQARARRAGEADARPEGLPASEPRDQVEPEEPRRVPDA